MTTACASVMFLSIKDQCARVVNVFQKVVELKTFVIAVALNLVCANN